MAAVLAEILISLFAVFGLYAAVRLFCILRGMPDEVAAALTVTRAVSEEEAAWLLWRARENTVSPASRVVVLLAAAAPYTEENVKIFVALGATCYLIND
ncbi:MAG: hypothetical protein IJW51_02385 [Clostridia bacterium]|nr:hypothetical protein [Clostridia bacterium]